MSTLLKNRNYIWAAIIINFVFSNVTYALEKQQGPQALAYSLYKRGEYKKAFNLLKKSFEEKLIDSSNEGKARLLMGLCQEKRMEFLEAKYYFKQAVQFGESMPQDYKSRTWNDAQRETKLLQHAYNMYAQKDFKASNQVLNQLIQLELYKLDRIEPFLLSGRNAVQLSQEHAAKKHFKEIFKINKTYLPDPAQLSGRELDVFNLSKEEFNSFGSKMKRLPGNLVRNKWTYIVAGGITTGVIIYSMQDNTQEEPDLPEGPAFPLPPN